MSAADNNRRRKIMKALEILNVLELFNTKHSISHASKISDIFNFWEKHKQFICTISKEVCTLNFGKCTEYNYRLKEDVVLNKGTDFDGVKYMINTQIGAAKGVYSVSIPNLLVNYFESIIYSQKKEVTNNEYSKELTKVKKVVNSTYSDYSNVVLVEKQADEFVLVYTNGFILYKSKPFNLDRDNSFYLDAKTFKEIEFFKYPDYKNLLKPTNKGVIIDRKEFLNNIKINLPYCNKYTNKINLHLNGKICFNSQDVDYGKDINTNMPYYEKQGFNVFDISINGKQMQKILSVLNTDIVSLCFDTPQKQIYIKSEDVECLLMPTL